MRTLIVVVLLGLAGFYVGWPAYSAYQIQTALSGGDPAVIASKVDFPSVRTSLKPAVSSVVDEQIDEMAKQSGAPAGAVRSALKPLAPQMTSTILSQVVTPENAIKIAQGSGSITSRVTDLVQSQIAQVADIGGSLGGLLSRVGGGRSNGGGVGGGALGGLGGLVGGGALNTEKIGGFLGANRAADAALKDEDPAEVAEAADDAGSGDGAGEGRSFGIDNIKSFGFDGPLAFSIGLAQDPNATRPDVVATMSFVDFDWKITGLEPTLDR